LVAFLVGKFVTIRWVDYNDELTRGERRTREETFICSGVRRYLPPNPEVGREKTLIQVTCKYHAAEGVRTFSPDSLVSVEDSGSVTAAWDKGYKLTPTDPQDYADPGTKPRRTRRYQQPLHHGLPEVPAELVEVDNWVKPGAVGRVVQRGIVKKRRVVLRRK
jgi:hypothetical protein